MIDSHASLSEKFLRKGFWLYFFTFISGPIGYITKMTLSNSLKVEEIGIIYGIVSLITIISAYNDMGMTESLNYFIPKYITEKNFSKIKTALLLSLTTQTLTGISIALFFYFGSNFISQNYFHTTEATNVLKVFSLYFLGINFFQVVVTFFVAIQNTFFYKFSEFIRVFFVFLCVTILMSLGINDLESISYSWIIGLYTGAIFGSLLFFTKYYKKYFTGIPILWEKKFFYQIISYAFFVVLGTQSATILGQIDMQIIIYMLGTKDAGFYTNYLSLITIPFLAIGPIFGLLFPVFSELNSKGMTSDIKKIKDIFTKIFFIIGIVIGLYFFTFSDFLAIALFGEKFIKSGEILRYCIFFLCFNFLLQINFNILSGIGKVTARVKIIGSAIILNIVTTIFLIKILGVSGAALATGIGWIYIRILGEIFLGKEFKTKIPFKEIIINIGYIGSLSLFFGFLRFMYPFYISRPYIILLLLFTFLIYCLCFSIININFLKSFLKEIKKVKN